MYARRIIHRCQVTLKSQYAPGPISLMTMDGTALTAPASPQTGDNTVKRAQILQRTHYLPFSRNSTTTQTRAASHLLGGSGCSRHTRGLRVLKQRRVQQSHRCARVVSLFAGRCCCVLAGTMMAMAFREQKSKHEHAHGNEVIKRKITG